MQAAWPDYPRPCRQTEKQPRILPGSSGGAVHIFYINLQSRPDRRDFMERQARLLGLEMERFEAVTPADISADEIADAAPWIGKSELACSLSHRAVWQTMLERGLPAALVLEDDCALSQDASAVLADPALLSPQIDMLQFETHPSSATLGRPLPTAVASIGKRRMMSSCLGTCGYVITAAMARVCIDHPDLRRMDLGKFMFSRSGPAFLYGHRLFQAFPALATPIGALVPASDLKRSDVDPTRRKRNPATAPAKARRKSLRRRLAEPLAHARLSIKAFGLRELLAARYATIPFAGDRNWGLELLGEVGTAPPDASPN